ncbi:hypothetical protein NDQ57_00665 [Rossellomorea marisflavi]|uniref:hypothetical protein n=1 Tax=Rossellomorea marisflavi TaxID=189381 RepID=UPI00203A3A91|nr:hypothetical protein [Rossellomorea marisflavi]MCM2603218.1 hypothetical protein [Rossellomorea marisflavi]
MDNKRVKSAIDQIPVPKEKVFSAISEGLNQARPNKKRKVATGLTAAVASCGDHNGIRVRESDDEQRVGQCATHRGDLPAVQ